MSAPEIWKALAPLALQSLKTLPPGEWHDAETINKRAVALCQQAMRSALAYHSVALEDAGELAFQIGPDGVALYMATGSESSERAA